MAQAYITSCNPFLSVIIRDF